MFYFHRVNVLDNMRIKRIFIISQIRFVIRHYMDTHSMDIMKHQRLKELSHHPNAQNSVSFLVSKSILPFHVRSYSAFIPEADVCFRYMLLQR